MNLFAYVNMGKNLICSAYLKVRYGKKIKIAPLQMFGRQFRVGCKNNGRVSIGDRLFTRSHVFLLADGGDIDIGDRVFLNSNVNITAMERVVIEEGVTVANNVVIVDHDHDYKNKLKFICAPIHIKKDAWIGANVVILKGVTIGQRAVIAAGSVVNKNVPDDVVVAGVPAKIVRHIQ